MIASVPVFIYHHINRHRADTVTITPGAFAAQMDYLAANGIHTLSLDELRAFIDGSLKLQEPAVLLSFDDGWLDNYLHAWPVLRRHGQHGTFFLITDRTDRADRGNSLTEQELPTHEEAKRMLQEKDGGGVAMTWRHAEEMAAGGLCRFYSHTRSHRRCDELEGADLREELAGSRRAVEERLGSSCDVLCWPYGRFSPAALAAATAAGYLTLFTTRHGRVGEGSDPLLVPRIEAPECLEEFIRELEGV